LPAARHAAGHAFDGAWHPPRRETDVIPSRNALFVAGLAALLAAAHSAPDLAAQATAAAPDTVRRISLSEALQRLEVHNLELRLAQAEMAAAEARIAAAGVLPNPVLSATREQLAGEPGVYQETIVQVGQTFPIGGQRGLHREAARQTAEAARARLDGT
jgi:outer membrane protein TolC